MPESLFGPLLRPSSKNFSGKEEPRIRLFGLLLSLCFSLSALGGVLGAAPRQEKESPLREWEAQETGIREQKGQAPEPKRSIVSTPERKRAVKIAFYNTENLYDTLFRPGKEEFTPNGARRWNSQRYRDKITAIATVIDTLKADLIALCEVENEKVVRALMYAMQSDYNYIHRDSRDSRGMDIVFFYRPDRFFPHRTRLQALPGTRREAMVLSGELDGERCTFVWCHLPSQQNAPSRRRTAVQALARFCDSLQRESGTGKLMLGGDMNTTPNSQLGRELSGSGRFTPFTQAERKGYGSYAYRDRWRLYDFILLGTELQEGPGWHFTGRYGIFCADFLLTPSGLKKGYPHRSFDQGDYTQGYSDHLPVWIILEE